MPTDAPAPGVDAVRAALPWLPDASRPVLAASDLDALARYAGEIVPRLCRTVGWLRWPSLLLLLAGAAGPVLLLGLAVTWQGWPRIVGVVVALLSLVPVVLFGRARAGTLRGARDPAALTRELVAFAAHLSDGAGILQRLAAVVQGGGLRLVPRLRALWTVVQLPSEIVDHLDSHPHLRWFLPPRLPETWVRFGVMAWTSIGCYALSTVLGALSLTPVL